MLQCTACRAALEIDIPTSLSATARQSLTSQLEQQLEAVHRTGCRFKHDAAYYFGGGDNDKNDDDDDGSSSLVVPMILAQVFRPKIMELLDPPKPQTVTQERCKVLLKSLRMMMMMSKTSQNKDDDDDDDDDNEPFVLQIPKQLLQYGVQQQEGSEQSSMLSRVSEALFENNDENNRELFQDKQLTTKVLALVILGWLPVQKNGDGDDDDDNDDDASHNCQLECLICWSRYSPILPRAAESSESLSAATATTAASPRPTKRARTTQQLDALQAHRHYCPFVCGFPRAKDNTNSNKNTIKPLWQSLLQRLLPPCDKNAPTLSTATTKTTPSRVEIFEMLQSGVSQYEKFALSEIVESSP